MKVLVLCASITLFGVFICLFVYGMLKYVRIEKQENNQPKQESLNHIVHKILCVSACFAFMSSLVSIILVIILIYDNNYYRVLDIYTQGVAVRCLTDDDHKTSVIPLSEDKVAKLKEFDLIDFEGNVIVSGIWFGAETATEPTPTETDKS